MSALRRSSLVALMCCCRCDLRPRSDFDQIGRQLAEFGAQRHLGSKPVPAEVAQDEQDNENDDDDLDNVHGVTTSCRDPMDECRNATLATDPVKGGRTRLRSHEVPSCHLGRVRASSFSSHRPSASAPSAGTNAHAENMNSVIAMTC